MTRNKEEYAREPRPEKIAQVDKLAKTLSESGGAVLTDYRGLSVRAINELRASLKEGGATYKVLKNNLLRRAAEKAEMEGLEQWLEGPVAAVFLGEDIVAPTKALTKFIKDHNNTPVIKGGFVEGKTFDEAAIKRLAELPPREVLLAMLLMTMKSPMSQLLSTLQASMVQLSMTLQALSEQKEAAAG